MNRIKIRKYLIDLDKVKNIHFHDYILIGEDRNYKIIFDEMSFYISGDEYTFYKKWFDDQNNINYIDLEEEFKLDQERKENEDEENEDYED